MKKCIFVISIVIFIVFIFISLAAINKSVVAINTLASDNNSQIVILDAGHGGEDGGAVAFDGTLEKDLNLLFTKKTALLFDIFGIEYYCIRTEDKSVGDTSLETIRERKVSDIKKRESIINSYNDPLFLSIHMNKFEIEKYSGAQVFYGKNNENSAVFASCIQNSIKELIQQDNNRKIKQSTKDIYLLYNTDATAVIVECGFLSNINELSLLKNEKYQLQLSYAIVSGILSFNNQRI